LDTAQQPFRSGTWIAALTVIVDRDCGDLARTRRLGQARFEHAVRRQILKRGGQKPSLRILRRLFAALDHPGVIAHRTGALERVQLLLEDWAYAHQRLADTETRMTGVLAELQLTALATSITGISAIGAAAILAQTGDPADSPHPWSTRWPRAAREIVRYVRRPHQTHRPRPPGLRLAAWRAVWAAQRANPVYRARYRHLTSREHNKLRPNQAQIVIAAAILRHLHAVITTRQTWDPAIATHGRRRTLQPAAAA
jgi:hypothetical protein